MPSTKATVAADALPAHEIVVAAHRVGVGGTQEGRVARALGSRGTAVDVAMQHVGAAVHAVPVQDGIVEEDRPVAVAREAAQAGVVLHRLEGSGVFRPVLTVVVAQDQVDVAAVDATAVAPVAVGLKVQAHVAQDPERVGGGHGVVDVGDDGPVVLHDGAEGPAESQGDDVGVAEVQVGGEVEHGTPPWREVARQSCVASAAGK